MVGMLLNRNCLCTLYVLWFYSDTENDVRFTLLPTLLFICTYLTTLALDSSVLQREIIQRITDKYLWICVKIGHRACDVVVLKALLYLSERPGIDSRWYQWVFRWHITFWPYHGSGVDSTPSENEYQEYLLGVKVAGAWGWQPYHLHVPNVMKSRSQYLLEPSGPHRVC